MLQVQNSAADSTFSSAPMLRAAKVTRYLIITTASIGAQAASLLRIRADDFVESAVYVDSRCFRAPALPRIRARLQQYRVIYDDAARQRMGR